MDSVIIEMILVAVLAGGMVSLAHRGRTRMWGLIVVFLSVGVSIMLYNFTTLLPNWKDVLLTTSACIVILVVLYLLLAIGGIRRNRPNMLTKNIDQAVVTPSSRTPVQISNCKLSVRPNIIKTQNLKKATARVVPKPGSAAQAKPTHLTAAAVEYTPFAAPDETQQEPLDEAVFAEPVLSAENTCVSAQDIPESDGADLAFSSVTEDNSKADKALEQLEKAQPDSVYITPSIQINLTEYEAAGQSDEARTESEYVLSTANSRLAEYETLGQSDEAHVESEIFVSVESADLGAENSDQPIDQITSEPSHTAFKDNMENIIQLVSAKQYADAQASIFKMLNSDYTMTSNDKRQLLLIMKLLREKEKKADGATRTR